MDQAVTELALEKENERFRGTGGISAENCSEGFLPAFRDTQTDIVYLSCFANGKRAPFHFLEGLPEELVMARDAVGRVATVKASVTSGFVRDGRFYSREEAALQLSGDLPVMLVDD